MGPSELMKEFNKVHQFVAFAVNHPVQKAIATFLQNENNYLNIGEMYQKKRDLFNQALAGSRFKIKPSQGTYFQLLDYSSISQDLDTEYAKELTIKNKIASIPVSVFYSNKSEDKVLRFCFAKKDETLLKAAEILCSI
jgi:methionine aminotransferase